MIRCIAILAIVAPLAGLQELPPATQPAVVPSGRIFSYREAEKARALARWECKPLVIHFVPDTQLGAKQLDAYYAKPGGASRELLDRVVIIAAPIGRYRGFARRLGINGDGGYRTISAYDLGVVDDSSQPTCRSGFV